MKQNRCIVYDTESVAKNQQNGKKIWLAELLLALGVLGVLFCFSSNIQSKWVLFAAMVAALLVLALISKYKPDSTLLLALPVAAGVAVVLFSPAQASGGLIYFCNQWITIINHCFDKIVPQLQVTQASDLGRTQVLFFLLMLLLVWLHIQIQKQHFICITVFAMAWTLMSAIFQLDVALWWMLSMQVGWLSIWLLRISDQKKVMRQLCFLLPCIAAVLLAGMAFSHYQGNLSVENLKTSIVDTTEKVRYGEDSLPKGDLSKASAMDESPETESLQVTFGSEAQELYLRGFVGAAFDGSVWNTFTYDDYTQEETSMLQWMSSQNFFSSFQYSNYEAYANYPDGKETNQITIKNTGADRRYLYLPYEVKDISGTSYDMNRDYQMSGTGVFGAKSYTLDVYKNVKTAESMVQNDLDGSISGAAAYDQTENVYRSYVYDNYLDVGKDEALIKDTFFKEGDWSKATLYEITEQIRVIFQSSLKYTDTPATYTGGDAFLTWLFELQKKGNASYFATAATLAYREAGIPARYVEGYHISQSDATKLKEAKQTTVTLKQKNSHAWVEVYVDGIGWMPVEVIPGFYYAEYTNQQIVGSPQSTVDIVNNSDEPQMQGSTTDSLTQQDSSNKNQTPDVPVEKIVHTIGMSAMVLVILWLLHLLVLFRYRMVRSASEKFYQNATGNEVARRRYHHVNEMMVMAGLPVKAQHPFENTQAILEQFPQVQEFEYKRFIQLLQKVVFGGEELTEAESITIQVFDEKMTDMIYESLSIRKKLIMKYWKGFL